MERLWWKALARWTGWETLEGVDLPGALILVLAAVIAMALGHRPLRQAGLGWRWDGLGTVGAAMFGGALGGHWLSLAFQPARVAADPWLLLIIPVGGFSSLGVYLGAAAAVVVFARWRRLPLWTLADALAPGAMVGAAVARLGCLLSGCDFGRLAPGLPWAIRYPRGTLAFAWQEQEGLVGVYQRVGLPMHPFPLYEALPVAAVGLALLGRPGLLGQAPGQRASGVAALYCAARLVAEHFRADTPALWGGGPTVMQALCVLALGLTLGLWRHLGQAQRPAPPTEANAPDVEPEPLER